MRRTAKRELIVESRTATTSTAAPPAHHDRGLVAAGDELLTDVVIVCGGTESGDHMQTVDARLAIGYGADSTRAVLAWPDGRWQQLSFDGGQPLLSSAVHTAGMLVGQAAWRQAASTPDGFVPAPLRTITGTDDQAASELVVATLRQVAAEAWRTVGAPVTDVRMVVPAGWGPRRRTWLRQAAYAAGLGQPRLVEAPVAAADRLLSVGVQVPVGGFLLIIDVGAGGEASVLRRAPGGFEVLSTLADLHAAAYCIDERLIAALTDDPAPAGGDWWLSLAAVRAAREQLTTQTVVIVPIPGRPPMVVHSRLVEQTAEPVWKQTATLAAQAVTAAELSIDQLAGVYLIGGAAATPSTARVIGGILGAEPVPVAEPGIAALLGAAGIDTGAPAGVAAEPADTVQPPPLRRAFGILLPGLASLILYCHTVFAASFNNGTPSNHPYGYYVLATWGEFSIAAVFALVACLAAGSLLGAALTQALHRDGAATPPALSGSAGRVAGGIVLAIVTGGAIAALYGVVAGVYFGVPASRPLGWTVWPIMPIAALAAIVAWLAAGRQLTPPRGWDDLLNFPASSVALTTVGMIGLAIWWNGPIPAVIAGWSHAIGRTGGFLIGAGIACALVRHWTLRAGLGLFLALFGFVFVGAGGTNILAVLYAIAVALWWAYRLWFLLRLPAAHRHAY